MPFTISLLKLMQLKHSILIRWWIYLHFQLPVSPLWRLFSLPQVCQIIARTFSRCRSHFTFLCFLANEAIITWRHHNSGAHIFEFWEFVPSFRVQAEPNKKRELHLSFKRVWILMSHFSQAGNTVIRTKTSAIILSQDCASLYNKCLRTK